MGTRTALLGHALLLATFWLAPPLATTRAAEFRSDWPEGTTRPWAGREYWANRLQDWRIAEGRLECLNDRPEDPYRTVHLLTHRLGKGPDPFAMSVRLGAIRKPDARCAEDALAGFLIGVGGDAMDYRAAAMVHRNPGEGGGWLVGIDGGGRLVLRSFANAARGATAGRPAEPLPDEVVLSVAGRPVGEGLYEVEVTARDAGTGELIRELKARLATDVTGNVALVSHPGTGPDAARFGFRDWTLSGPKVEAHPERAFGPILATQYTVHDGVLKLTAQLAPIGVTDPQTATLEVKEGDAWKVAATARIITPGYTAPFRVEGWDASRNVEFRVAYELEGATYQWPGTVRRDPVDRPTIILAALSCNENFGGGPRGGGLFPWARQTWFPHADLTPNLARHDPDLYFFAGDQIYEGNPTPPVRAPIEDALLDYLYKWFLWCWAYGDLVRGTPSLCIPDDHDVYQGNLWGMGGAAAQTGDAAGLKGGYGMPPLWIRMIERTQTSHLPDPVDPTPVEQGIGVYYTRLTLGEIGFAILEDRKFKSSPTVVNAEMTPDSHIIEPGFDTARADVPGATLLGDRQLAFLRDFAADWRGQRMKAALSQTIFANLQISSRPPTTGQLDKDLDSNGWPQSGRNAALRELRRGFLIHIAGDQHLASVIHHGIDDWEDAGWSFCVPAIANLYPRYWNPPYPPLAPHPVNGPNTGRYRDGFGNRLTVFAVANPDPDPQPGTFPEPSALHSEAVGYGIIRFHKPERTMTLELWPRYVDPTDPSTGGQYAGWPITVRQEDNDGRTAVALLPRVIVEGMDNPVVQVIAEEDGEVVNTLRIEGHRYQPRVHREGRYTLRIGEPGSDRLKVLEGVESLQRGEDRELVVRFD